jgi:hypothetical protein
MESEDGTGSRHTHAVFKEMWIATHLFHFAVKRVTLVIRFFYIITDTLQIPYTYPYTWKCSKIKALTHPYT